MTFLTSANFTDSINLLYFIKSYFDIGSKIVEKISTRTLRYLTNNSLPAIRK